MSDREREIPRESVRPLGGNEVYREGDYLERNPEWHVEGSAWKADQIQRMLKKHGVEPRDVVDVGCGAGEILVELARRLGPTVQFTGYEIAPAAYDICRPKTTDNVHFELADYLETPDRSHRPDLILLIDVMEHIEDIFGFLRQIRCRSDNFIFHIPLDMNAQAALRRNRAIEPRRQYAHVHSFNRDIALAQLADTGFEVVDDVYTPHWRGLPPASRKAALALWPRRVLFAVAPDLAIRALGGASLLVLAR